jgi:hypothetical protein
MSWTLMPKRARSGDNSDSGSDQMAWLLAIGKRLQLEYDDKQQLPTRLVGLVQQLEVDPESEREPRTG